MVDDIIIIAYILGTDSDIDAFDLQVFYDVIGIAFFVSLVVICGFYLPDNGKTFHKDFKAYGITYVFFDVFLCSCIIVSSCSDHIALIKTKSDEHRRNRACSGCGCGCG